MVAPTPTHLKHPALLADIERGLIKIPQFQREFVWSLQSSAKLLDSVIKGYPVGTFIFWTTRERLRSVREIGGITLPDAPEGTEVAFVLDGQQRLTSLFAAIRGEKIVRPSGSIDDFSLIFIDLKATEHDSIVVTDVSDLEPGSWITLTDLLTGGTRVAKKYADEFLDNIDSYRERLASYDFPIVKVADVEIDVATEIFTRINVGGKSLTTFEIMAAKTYDETRDFDLSAKFDDLLGRLESVEYETVSDAILLQLVSLILDGECNKKSILRLDKNEFIDCWPAATDALESAVEYFRGTYRIPASKLLPFNALLVPFAYFFYHHRAKPNPNQKKLLEDFFWRCALGGRYSASTESRLAQDKHRIDRILTSESPDYDWAVDVNPEFLIQNGWFTPSRAFVKAILCLFAYHEPKSFEDNAKVHIGNAWLKQANSRNYHHFFPRAYLKKKGRTEREANNVLNITIVDADLNKRLIRADAPSKYMKRFSESNPDIEKTMASHLIGSFKRFGFGSDDYDVFLRRRAELVSAELSKRIIDRPVDQRGQVARDDDLDEEPSDN
ncbi:DUF262 domain-containing protein [Rhodococcus hoagii]|uniref:DUF262 domain-containing protein n=1 Tax=Rhodococcus sp. SGAir0479 TaxID=2567884 RepID=UPI0010CD2F56|nr:DUF262 domain-containing protein [Rhodococcus sp. SGAir0479]MBM4732597.1 DUF262 domain-containing protein [Prescottella equi]NKS77759.1 DUF262 domain-containing protein [Prescottella equi]NKZ67062.1 DUF262 domain-containing protein [Prescottella equi]QCQ90485.1 DUF262 domain-containing protein [Rhodococcus sp. SGAir0479]BCN48386.1 hypothetical protein RE9416_16870 [Prescottella equi]